MADGIFGRLGALFGIAPEPPKPYKQQGVPGYSSWGGWVIAPEENPDLSGPNRWKTASDLLANISIIAASARYSLNLISRPSWKADPPSDKPEAKAMAEFVEEVINGIDTSWARIIRRSAMYRYHGFNLQEWVAKKRDDGKIGIESVEQRPVHTVHRWDLDDNGGLLGVVQVSPQTGKEIYLPRQKLIYLVDDALTDRPDGYGWFRHLAEPASRLKRYLKLETMGFERDLAGIPVGRAPLQRINELVKAGKLEQKQADKMIKSLEDFVQLQAKTPETGLVFDSEPFRAKTESGETISGVQQWGVELLTASPSSVAALGDAIHRLMSDMAMIIGTESLLIGQHSSGSGGSRALSQDKSRNLYLTSNAALSDMAESYDRDIVTTLWNLNGFDEELRPKLKTEDVSFQDAGEIAQALAEMATAGAILAPDDPAINDVREILGISPAPPMDTDTSLMLRGKSPAQQPPGGGAPGNGTNPPRENPGGGPGGKPPPDPSGGSGRAQKNDPTTLYVSRELENPEPFIAWAKASGFETTLPPGDLHVTVAFSRAPLDWTKVPTAAPTVIAQGGQRSIQPLGDKGAVVLLFESPELSQRWKQLCDLGASWDYDGYRPHVSISYSGTPGLDLSKITPYDGPLEFGPEVFAPVNEDWSTGVTEKFNPNHVASGPNGGEFTTATNVSGPGGLSDFMTQLANDPDHHPNIEGLKVDGEAIFHPDKNLRLRREQMPQIPDVHREAFLTTVPNKLEMANPRDLFPSQDQIDGYKTAILATKDIPFQSPIVSADNYIIDGHHHWSSAVVKSVIRGSNQPAMPIHRVNLAHGDLIQRARTYATAHGFKEEPLWKYSPDEPRDDHGRWTTGGPGTIQQLSPAQMAEAMRILRTANWAKGPFSGVRGMLNAQTDQIDETLDHAQWERPGDFKPWQGVMKYSDSEPRDYHGRWTDGGGSTAALGAGLIDEKGNLTPNGLSAFSSNWIGGNWESYQQAARSIVNGQSAEDFAAEVGTVQAKPVHGMVAGVIDKINTSAPLDYPLYRGLVGVDYKVGDTFSESLTTWTSNESLAHDFAHDHFHTSAIGDVNGAVFKVSGTKMHGFNITDLNPDRAFEGPLLRSAAEHITSGQYRVTSVTGGPGERVYEVERIGSAKAVDLKKYSDSQPRDYHGRWTSGGGGGGGAAVLFEVSPNPDNKALADRWNKLSSSQKQAITDKLARRYTPMVMDAIGVQGHLEPAMGGFEGEVNPSLYMNVSERPFDTAGAIGDTFGQKAMVVMSDSPGKGLSAHGMVSILAPGADAAKLSELQGQIGSLADGFTYHNGRVQILNFSGKADAAFAADIDQALGGNYIVEHAKVYSAYIEESDYARPEGDSAGGAWGQVRGHVRSAFSQSLEQELGKAGT